MRWAAFREWISPPGYGQLYREIKKKNPRPEPWIYANPARLDCTGHIAGAETPCTDVYMARSTIDNCLNTLHIGLPSLVGTSVRVGDLNTKGNALAAKITFSHLAAPPRRI